MTDDATPIEPSLWTALRAHTPARIGLGRVGVSVPTAQQLRFQVAHARARDAVHTTLDTLGLLDRLAQWSPIAVRSMAPDRATYLRRPDLGRRLHQDCHLPAAPGSLAIVIADGLSAAAVNAQAARLTDLMLAELGWPTQAVLAEQARVALGDDVAAAMRACAVVVLIGERPGLSAADSMGAYISWAPYPGMPDADRTCVSNIRPGGLGLGEAAATIARILRSAQIHRRTGVRLSATLHAMLDT